MTGATNSYYPNGQQEMPIYGVSEEAISSSYEPSPTSFLYNLSLLKDKVHQVQSLATIFLSPDHGQPPESTAIAVPTMGTLIQEIIVTASSMMFACHQLALESTSTVNNAQIDHQRANRVAEPGPTTQSAINNNNNNNTGLDHQRAKPSPPLVQSSSGGAYFTNQHDTFDHWYGDTYNNFTNTNNNIHSTTTTTHVSSSNTSKEGLTYKMEKSQSSKGYSPNNCDIVELDASDLLAKYTHYCQVCGKGFKRDANLRMHMRAHGDEYKSSAALSNPMKNNIIPSGGESAGNAPKVTKKYSCPQEGCRWNKKHAKFQPLKSMICVKNHYKRSHCPKMYVCKRCNTKQFSVLSDLRTHEKHCGDLKWRCLCGTTFSRKDKLMGHVALFLGHSPVDCSLTKVGSNVAKSVVQMQLDDTM